MSLKGYYEASLRPPAEDDVFTAAAAATKWDWGEALLDRAAYMVDKVNHTSARCRFRRDVLDEREVEMRVTLCLAPPPLVSYFCCHAYYTDDKGEDNRLFISEPSMFAMEGDLALITLCHGKFHPSAINGNKGYYEYLVYQAGKEELTRLPHPDPWMLPNERSHCFNSTSIAVVPYSSKISPKDDDDAYRIAALGKDFFHDSANGPHYLCIYDSKAGAWTRKAGAIPQPLPPPSDFISDMSITIGGNSGGIVGWVDLWSGMLLSDVLADDTPFHQFRYVPLPEPRQPPNRLPLAVDIATAFRDIVLVKETGIIRFVDLQVHGEPGNPFSETPSGWTVVTWTMEGLRRDSVTLGDMRFKLEHEVHSCDIENYDLPKSVFVSNPILSSHKDGILYLRTTVSSKTDRNSRVIAVDIKNKKLLKVGEFDMRRPNTYRRTTISSYLKPPVSKENMKRGAPVSAGSYSRKRPQQQPAITNPAEGGEGDAGDAMDWTHSS
ncbi:hypothetical protein CFC21_040253 [Triticum aestivum]|uniref:DUF1618 domain-containing protein n=3 Tax=Triticum TaxID=4564 RepID=A0A9R1FG70_WHEAT|nr:uncharacterized protein LOC123065016 [Triticum aestivum]KAF7028311.1 hypothetical protein CFC21_040253 [Triticum aestivum]CDM81656.1 unnamed protein product [Triticum aestivum]VAH73628.1 unnamed protein product [Triticum turgidum subsp. durum]